MKTTLFAILLITAFLVKPTAGHAQGTVTFDQPPVGSNVVHYLWFYNDPSGMSFSIAPQVPDNYLERLTGVSGHPSNGSAHLEQIPFWPIQPLTTFNLATASAFGLVSVDLADPVAPSLSPVSITFNGFREDNSMITQSFTVGGGSSSAFQTFLFGQDFASGLVRVEIPSGAWAMDNLAFTVPEPRIVTLTILGLLNLALRRRGDNA